MIVGRGAQVDLVDRLRDDFPDSVEHVERLLPAEVAARMDGATCLVLPSRSEGLPRVILESFARGRSCDRKPCRRDRRRGRGRRERVPRRGRRRGGARGGADADALGPELAARLGAAAHDASRRLHLSADDFAARVRSLVDKTLTGARP